MVDPEWQGGKKEQRLYRKVRAEKQKVIRKKYDVIQADPRFTEFSVEDLVGQRIYGLALGYEDLNDHEGLRADPLMAVLVGKEDPLGRDRRAEADRGKACAGKSTLNRLELSSVTQDKYRKTPVDEAAVEAFLVEQFIRVRGGKPKELVLDLDATDDPLHGEQEGCFYHGYYRCYCYLPLYVFCEGYVLGGEAAGVEFWMAPKERSRRWSGSWDNCGRSGRRSA